MAFVGVFVGGCVVWWFYKVIGMSPLFYLCRHPVSTAALNVMPSSPSRKKRPCSYDEQECQGLRRTCPCWRLMFVVIQDGLGGTRRGLLQYSVMPLFRGVALSCKILFWQYRVKCGSFLRMGFFFLPLITCP